MKRRDFLVSTAALALVGGQALAANGMVPFTDADPIATALSEGKTVFVDYGASWCSTCARQARVITELRAQNPAYDENIVFVHVDWDDYMTHPVTTSRNIPRRSTLVVLHGDQELGRLVAATGEQEIRNLMDIALSAATS